MRFASEGCGDGWGRTRERSGRAEAKWRKTPAIRTGGLSDELEARGWEDERLDPHVADPQFAAHPQWR